MELNPNHGVTQEVRGQWHKLLAIWMHKQGLRSLTITSADIDAFSAHPGGNNITIRPAGRVLVIELVSDKEAARLAREEGGLPV